MEQYNHITMHKLCDLIINISGVSLRNNISKFINQNKNYERYNITLGISSFLKKILGSS